MTSPVQSETKSLPANANSRAYSREIAKERRFQRILPFRTLDVLRGFAAIWVVMRHSCDRFVGGANESYTSQPLYAFSLQGGLGVVLFFVISGYCITAAAHGALYSDKTLFRYGYERGRRIFPPYWAALIMGIAVQSALRAAESHHWIPRVNHQQAITLITTPLYWVANFTLTQYEWHTDFANVVFWSLCYEVAFYVVIGVCLFAAKRMAAARDIAAGQLTLILALAGVTAASQFELVLSGVSIFPFDLWPQFAMGGLLFYLFESRPETVAGYSPRFRLILNGIAAVTIALSLLYTVIHPGGSSEFGELSLGIRTSFCLVFCLFLAAIRRFDARIAGSRWVRPLLWLGACSYSLYLFHPIVLPFIDVAGRKIGLDGDRYWITFWLQVVVSAGFGRFLYLLVERHFVSSRQIKRLKEENAA